MVDSQQQQPFTLITGGAGDENVNRLQQEVAARKRQETAIAELGQAALTGIDGLVLLGQACALVESALEMCHCRALELTPGGRLVVRASIGSDPSLTNCPDDADEDESIGMFVVLSDAPVTFMTAADETRFKCSHIRDAHNVACGAGVTIRNQYGRLGVLLAYSSRERTFPDYQLSFLRSVADIVGQALARGRTEAALVRSESRLKQLINSAVDAVITLDRHGMVIEWNPQAEAIFGIPARDIIGGPLPSSIFGKRDYRLIQRLVRREGREARLRLLRRRRAESVATRVDGETFPIEVTVEAVDTPYDQVFTLFIRDISERKRAQQALEQSERRFRTIVEKSWSGVALLDSNFHFSYAGSSTPNILGYSEKELIGRDLFPLVHPREREAARRMLRNIGASPGKEAHGELRFRHKHGTWIWLEGFAQNMIEEPSVGAIVLNYRYVTQRRMTEKQLEYRAHYDALTDLPNRVLFRDRVVNGLAQARRNHHGLAILYLDVDHFKTVNDALGHSFGDALLSSVARRLQACLRASDTISRIGGDEFAILINDVDEAEAVGVIAHKLLESFIEPFRIEGREIFVTASIGISFAPSDGEDVETLVKCADAAMYRSKELGRNQVQLFTPSMNERYVRRLALEQSLHLAVERNEFVLHYQPVYDRHRLLAGIEALIRWRDPKRGLIMPGEFIPLAEETGLVMPIGSWVVHQVCRMAREWRPLLPPNARISMNISPYQLQKSDFVRTLQDAMRATSVAPESIQIEITETAAKQNIDRTMRALRELRGMGVAIAVDDFGTGQSSLIHLKQLPIHAIKIDRPFVRDAVTDGTAAAIVTYVTSLAHAMNLTVTAEGVENEEEYAFLQKAECDHAQGYLFSRPLPQDEMDEFLRRGGMPPRDRLRAVL